MVKVKRCPKCGSSNVGRICSRDYACREPDCRYRGRREEFEVDKFTDEEIDELIDGAIKRKKKGIRYSGKYKGRGKAKKRLP